MSWVTEACQCTSHWLAVHQFAATIVIMAIDSIILLYSDYSVLEIVQLTAGNTKVKGKRSAPVMAREIPISCRVHPSPPEQEEVYIRYNLTLLS